MSSSRDRRLARRQRSALGKFLKLLGEQTAKDIAAVATTKVLWRRQQHQEYVQRLYGSIPYKVDYIFLREELSEELNIEFFAQEFDLIKNDARIKCLCVSHEEKTFAFETAPILKQYCGHMVFLARYRVQVSYLDRSHVSFRVKCLEHGCKSQPRPLYWTEAGFCFDRRRPYIDELYKHGELMQSCFSILESLWHVNETEYEQLADYKRVPDEWQPESYLEGKEEL